MMTTRFPVYPRDKYGALFDAHVHTYFDLHDGTISPKDLITITKKRGFNWVNAMAHDTLRGVPKIQKLAREEGIPVLPSMEISTGFNHILAYGVQEWHLAKDSWDPEIVIDALRDQDCAIYLSHPGLNPFRGYWTPKVVRRLDIDGLEWLNGSIFGLNRRTQQWFRGWKKGRIAGSDAHHPSQFGYAYTQIPTQSKDPDDIVKLLQQGKCYPRGGFVPFHRFLLWETYINLKRHFFPQFAYEGSWIKPQYQPMGELPPSPFDVDVWKSQLLQKPPLHNW